eukprot:scaffold347_cov239-Pinguiococcus_pyrenoidosus.AAC.3
MVALMDLRNNSIGFLACTELEASAASYRKAHSMKQSRVGSKADFVIQLDGNKGIDEILNAVSHGIGTVLSIIGTIFLSIKVREPAKQHGRVGGENVPAHECIPDLRICTTGCAASRLVGACVCDALLHQPDCALHQQHLVPLLPHVRIEVVLIATRARYTRWVFGTMDHCAIYILIAGSYTPFLGILLPHEEFYVTLLLFLWGVAVFGLMFSAGYEGSYKVPIELALYLGMGWAAMICLDDMTKTMGSKVRQYFRASSAVIRGLKRTAVGFRRALLSCWRVGWRTPQEFLSSSSQPGPWVRAAVAVEHQRSMSQRGSPLP